MIVIIQDNLISLAYIGAVVCLSAAALLVMWLINKERK